MSSLLPPLGTAAEFKDISTKLVSTEQRNMHLERLSQVHVYTEGLYVYTEELYVLD